MPLDSLVERPEDGGSNSEHPVPSKVFCPMLGDLDDLRLTELCNQMLYGLTSLAMSEGGTDISLAETPENVTVSRPNLDVSDRPTQGREALLTTEVGVQTERVIVTNIGESQVPSPDFMLSGLFVNGMQIMPLVSLVERPEDGGQIRSAHPARPRVFCSMLGDLDDLRLMEICDEMLYGFISLAEIPEGGTDIWLKDRRMSPYLDPTLMFPVDPRRAERPCWVRPII